MAYKVIKVVIQRGGYNHHEIMEKLDAYMAFGRITPEQYTELAEMVQKDTEK